MKRILSIDGGGIRGCLPTCFLIELERHVGKPCREIFDYVCGTSTGALISWGISLGIPASHLQEIYSKRAGEIFNHSDAMATFNQIDRGYAFDVQNIVRVLEDEAGPDKRGWAMNDSPIGILMTGYSCSGHVWFFTRDTDRNGKQTGKLSMLECAAASAAAPTYFNPMYISPLGGELIGPTFDGGVAGYANPVYRGIVEATEYDSFSADPKETHVTSLGTGFFRKYASVAPNGILPTVKMAFRGLLDSASDEQTQIVKRHYPGLMDRFNWQLPSDIDEADKDAIPDLISMGTKLSQAADIESMFGLV